MSQKKVTVALVGYGYWGKNLLRNMFANPRMSVIGVVEKSAAGQQRLAQLRLETPVFSTMEQLFEAVSPEAVVIATPPDTHCEIAVTALKNGAHVLIEKPMATTTAECDRILDAAVKAKRNVMIDHTFLYHAPVRYLGKNIHEGTYGDLLYYDSVRVNLGGIQMTNVLWDLAPHDLSILDAFTKGATPNTVTTVGVKHFGYPVETMCYSTLQYDNNFIAHLHLNWIAPVKGRQITIGGSQKMVVWDDNTPLEKVRIYDRGVKIENVTDNDLKVNYRVGDMVAPAIIDREALSEMLNEFVDSIFEGRKPMSDGEHGRRVVQTLEAMAKSMSSQGTPVLVQPAKPRIVKAG